MRPSDAEPETAKSSVSGRLVFFNILSFASQFGVGCSDDLNVWMMDSESEENGGGSGRVRAHAHA